MPRRASIVLGVAVLASLLVGGLIAAWFFIDRMVTGPEFKSQVEDQAARLLGRPVTVEDLEWRMWPGMTLVGRMVRIWDGPSMKKALLELPQLEARMPLSTLPKLGIRAFKKDKEKNSALDANPVFSGTLHGPQFEIEFRVAITNDPDFTATIDLPDVRYRSEAFKNLKILVRRTDGVYEVDRTEFNGLGGTISVQGSYSQTLPDQSLKMHWKTVGINVQELFTLAGSSAKVSGLLDSDGRLESVIGKNFLPSLNGDVNLNLKNGWFGNVTGLLKILSKLNLTTVIEETMGSHSSRIPFDETHGSVNIKNGVASTVDPFVLENKTMQLAFLGDYNMPNNTLDGKVIVNVLLVTDEIIRRIPVVHHILHGDKKGLTPIWLSVKGSANDPTIRILPGRSIAGPVWNTIGNIFRLPKNLLQDIRGR